MAPQQHKLVRLQLLSLASAVLETGWPALAAFVIDRVVFNPGLTPAVKARELLWVGVAACLLSLTGAGLSWITALWSRVEACRLTFQLRSKLFGRVLRLPLADAASLRAGGIVSRLANDVEAASGLLQTTALNAASSAVRLVILLAIVVSLEPRMAALLLAIWPLVLLVMVSRARAALSVWRSLGEDRWVTDARIAEAIAGLPVVRCFHGERREELAHLLGFHTIIRKEMLGTRLLNDLKLLVEVVATLCQIVVVCSGGYLLVRNEVSIGVVMACQGYAAMMLEPIRQLGTVFIESQSGLAAVDRIGSLLDRATEPLDSSDAVSAPSEVGEIRFERVCFAYRSGTTVVEDFDLVVPGGAVVALTGPSGAGKTTITQLLARFHEPTSGAIRLNGVDLRQIKRKSLRAMIGIVAQDTFLFDGSVRENISYGRPAATLADVQRAAALAHAHEFITRLPGGYDCRIGERGARLSGGQRQRLALARAFLIDPRILILDEATSNLDTESEHLIQAAMRSLIRGRTTFIIAHRLSTIRHADEIVVLSEGRITERGSHEALMLQHGSYHRVVQLQRQADALVSERPAAHVTLDESA